MADEDRGYRYGAPPTPTADYSQLNQGLGEPTGSNPGGGTAFPGRVPGESRQAYNAWWEEYSPDIQPWIDANPGREDEFMGLAWTWRNNPTRLRDEVLKAGFAVPASPDSGGGRRGGGGGGGGATKEQQYASAEAAVRNRAGMLGITFDDAAIMSIAKTVVDASWSSDQLDDYLVPAAQSTNQAGVITATVNQVQQLAARQLLKVSDATAREWAARVASGEMDLDGVQSLLQAQAVQRYGWAASQISQGIGVRDLLLPTRDRIADELEMNPEEIDLMDEQWLGMVQTADANGQIRAATDSEAIMRARQRAEWANTRKAGDLAANTVMTIRNYFGG